MAPVLTGGGAYVQAERFVSNFAEKKTSDS